MTFYKFALCLALFMAQGHGLSASDYFLTSSDDESGDGWSTDSEEEREHREVLDALIHTDNLATLKLHRDVVPHIPDMVKKCDLKEVLAFIERCFWYIDPRLKQKLEFRRTVRKSKIRNKMRKSKIRTSKMRRSPFYLKSVKMADIQRSVITLFVVLLGQDVGYPLAEKLVRNGLLHWCEDDMERRALQDRALLLCELLVDEEYEPEFFDEALNLARLSALQERDTKIETNWFCIFESLLRYHPEYRRKIMATLAQVNYEYPNRRAEALFKIWGRP
jgi:hypothetical protein